LAVRGRYIGRIPSISPDQKATKSLKIKSLFHFD
jgi:hypothetical protein